MLRLELLKLTESSYMASLSPSTTSQHWQSRTGLGTVLASCSWQNVAPTATSSLACFTADLVPSHQPPSSGKVHHIYPPAMHGTGYKWTCTGHWGHPLFALALARLLRMETIDTSSWFACSQHLSSQSSSSSLLKQIQLFAMFSAIVIAIHILTINIIPSCKQFSVYLFYQWFGPCYLIHRNTSTHFLRFACFRLALLSLIPECIICTVQWANRSECSPDVIPVVSLSFNKPIRMFTGCHTCSLTIFQ